MSYLIRLLFVNDGYSRKDHTLPAPDRLYASDDPGVPDAAALLFPGKNPVSMSGLAAAAAEESDDAASRRIVNAFDALLGNFRVLYQDRNRDITVAFVLSSASVSAILSARVRAGSTAPFDSDGILMTHVDGGYLIAE